MVEDYLDSFKLISFPTQTLKWLSDIFLQKNIYQLLPTYNQIANNATFSARVEYQQKYSTQT